MFAGELVSTYDAPFFDSQDSIMVDIMGGDLTTSLRGVVHGVA